MLSEGGIVLDKVKIAVIDNGVVEKVLRQPLEYRVCAGRNSRNNFSEEIL